MTEQHAESVTPAKLLPGEKVGLLSNVAIIMSLLERQVYNFNVTLLVPRLPRQARQGNQVQCHIVRLVSRLLSPHRAHQGMHPCWWD